MIIYDNLSQLNFQPTNVFLHFTGNIFGVGCSAFDTTAIESIIALKQRSESKGFVVLFSSLEQAKRYALPQLADARIFSLLNQYMPANLTAVLHTDDERFRDVWLDHKIAIRVPVSKLLRDFIQKIDTPIISTSINLSSEPICTDLDTILEKYSHWFDWGLYDKFEKADTPLPSTIIQFTSNTTNNIFSTHLTSTPDCQMSIVNCQLLREGSVPFAEIKASFEKPLINFVCIGNICRSPMAELYARKKFSEEQLPYRLASCGLIDRVVPISEHSRTLLEKHDIPVGNHHSTPVDADIVRQSVVLLCMANDIKKHLRERFPDAAHKIYTFAEFTKHTKDIEDPYGCDYSYYQKAYKLIVKYTEALINILKV